MKTIKIDNNSAFMERFTIQKFKWRFKLFIPVKPEKNLVNNSLTISYITFHNFITSWVYFMEILSF